MRNSHSIAGTNFKLCDAKICWSKTIFNMHCENTENDHTGRLDVSVLNGSPGRQNQPFLWLLGTELPKSVQFCWAPIIHSMSLWWKSSYWECTLCDQFGYKNRFWVKMSAPMCQAAHTVWVEVLSVSQTVADRQTHTRLGSEFLLVKQYTPCRTCYFEATLEANCLWCLFFQVVHLQAMAWGHQTPPQSLPKQILTPSFTRAVHSMAQGSSPMVVRQLDCPDSWRHRIEVFRWVALSKIFLLKSTVWRDWPLF